MYQLKNFLKRRKFLKSANALDLVPVPIVKHELNEEGFVKLLIPRFQNKFLKNFFIGNNRSNEFKISLDEIGSFVWLSIDGHKTTGDITEELRNLLEIKNLRSDSIEERVVAFISKLYREKYVTFVGLY